MKFYFLKYPLIFAAVFFVFFTPLNEVFKVSAAGTTLVSVTINNRTYYPLSQIAAKLGLRYRVNGDTCELIAQDNRKIIFRHNKRSASINGVAVTLDFAALKHNSKFYLSTSDYKYLINPLYDKSCLKGKRPRIIVIDAGHGGKDQGAAGKKSLEKNLNLIMARKLRDKLRSMGYTVYMTRDSDVKIELADRAARARNLKADLFISIHMNAASDTSVRGVETFALTPPGAPSSSDTRSSMPSCRGYPMAANSTALAFSVQSQIVRTMQVTDRGVKRARFKVLTDNTAPSILIECGFISNTAEENLLRSATYQNNMINAIATGIDRYAKRLPQ